MLPSFLMGLVGGQRAMTPLAAVSVAAARGGLPADSGAPRIIASPLVAMAMVLLAVAELGGDKMRTAPDRTVPVGLAARFVTSAVAGAALTSEAATLARRRRRSLHCSSCLLSRLAPAHGRLCNATAKPGPALSRTPSL